MRSQKSQVLAQLSRFSPISAVSPLDGASAARHLAQILSSLLVLVALPALTGCASMKVRMGMAVDLTKVPITSMSVKLPSGPAIAPGEKSPLVVNFVGPNGKALQTEGKGGGKVMWKDLAVAASVVKVNSKGVVSLARDPRVSDGKVGHVMVTVPTHPDLRAELDIPLRYDRKYAVDFSGSRGLDGLSGRDGMNGSDGMMGSLDPNNPSPGGNGSKGEDGTNGEDGGRGGDAPAVQVRVALRAGVHPLLQVAVSAAGEEKFYLIDPNGGSLVVRADGGQGGSGGRGGRGGRGGSGGIGSPNGTNGMNGMDGRSGFDGQSGWGGEITVIYDPRAKPYLKTIQLSSAGGPAPMFREESVPPLW